MRFWHFYRNRWKKTIGDAFVCPTAPSAPTNFPQKTKKTVQFFEIHVLFWWQRRRGKQLSPFGNFGHAVRRRRPSICVFGNKKRDAKWSRT